MDTLAKLRAGQLTGLKRLDLSCGLTEFPEEIFQLADSLEILNLSGNALCSLPQDLHRLTHLRVLFCSDNLFTTLASSTFATPTVPPAMAWIDAEAPAAPTLANAVAGAATWQLTATAPVTEPLRWWWVRWRTRSSSNAIAWHARLLPASATSVSVPATVDGARTDGVVLHAVDRVGNLSPPAIWRAP